MVLKRLLTARSTRKSAIPRIPPGQRVYAIGDIHGRLDLLDRVLEAIDQDDAQRPAAATRLIFLGDLVDRGPDSKGVIDRLIDLSGGKIQVSVLLGNHDEVFLKSALGDPKAVRMLTRIGGRETILSYGMESDEYQSYDFEQLVKALGEIVPPQHLRFLEQCEDYIELGDYLFVHAGVRPGVVIQEQATVDLRWIRNDFLRFKESHGKMIVHGHSISDDPDVRPNRIGIDTGAFASGRLTAMGLEDADRWFVFGTGAADPKWQRPTD